MKQHESIAFGRIGRGLVVVVLSTVACTSTGRVSSAGELGSLDAITREQIDPTDKDAFDVVLRLRPVWLRPRGRASLTTEERSYAAVFLDDVFYGSVDSLRGISSDEIDRIYFMNASDATTRYGTGYLAGIIHVRTAR